MPDTKKKDALATSTKRPRSGLYSWVSNKRLPKGQAFQAVRRELSQLAEDLTQAHGGASITPEARILVDSIVEGLGVQKILSLYIRKYGVIDNQAAKRGRLELSPILSRNWIGYANVVRQGILALRELEKGRQATPHAEIEAILTSYSRETPADDNTPAEGESKEGDDNDG